MSAAVGGAGRGFALIVVLFILLIIVGTAYMPYGVGGYGCYGGFRRFGGFYY